MMMYLISVSSSLKTSSVLEKHGVFQFPRIENDDVYLLWPAMWNNFCETESFYRVQNVNFILYICFENEYEV